MDQPQAASHSLVRIITWDHGVTFQIHLHFPSIMRRKFFETMEQSPRLVTWILCQIAHLYHIEKRLRITKADPSPHHKQTQKTKNRRRR